MTQKTPPRHLICLLFIMQTVLSRQRKLTSVFWPSTLHLAMTATIHKPYLQEGASHNYLLLFLHSTGGFYYLYIAPPIPLQVDDQQFTGEARENEDFSYHTRVIWAHIEWVRGQRKHRATAEEAQHGPARLSGQSVTGCNKRLAQSLVLNCTFVHQLTCLRALLCKSNFVKRDWKLFRAGCWKLKFYSVT